MPALKNKIIQEINNIGRLYLNYTKISCTYANYKCKSKGNFTILPLEEFGFFPLFWFEFGCITYKRTVLKTAFLPNYSVSGKRPMPKQI